MLTISDNAATDVVIDSVGLDRIHATLSALGLSKTVIPYRLSVMLDSLGEEVGFGGWRDLLDAAASPDASLDEDEVDRRLRESRALSAQHGMRTTAREMAMLLRMIWRDEAGPADACATVRKLMAQQDSSATASRSASRAALVWPPRVAACSA